MNKPFHFTLKLLFVLILLQSCQKENIERENEISALTDLNKIETRSESSTDEPGDSEGCNPIYVYADPITVTEKQFNFIKQELIYPGISIIDCEQIFGSYNHNTPGFYLQNLLNAITIIETTPSNQITFKIKPFRLHCYNKCPYAQICSATGLRIVKGTGANNCTLAILELVEFPEHLYAELNLGSYLDIATCNVAICNDDIGGE